MMVTALMESAMVLGAPTSRGGPLNPLDDKFLGPLDPESR
jgi:hypothetical protein